MPKALHEGLVELFRMRKTLAPELLQRVFQAKIPSFDDIEIKDSNLVEIVPTEARADLVLVLMAEAPVHAVIVEVQMARDPRKRFTWPLYAAMVRARYACPVDLLIVCPDARVARWAAAPITLMGDQKIRLPVLSPELVPWPSPEETADAPELGLLSAIAHAEEPDVPPLALSVLQAVDKLDDDLQRMYYDLLMTALPAAAKKELHAMAYSGNYEYQSEFAKKYLAQGIAQGEAKGRAEGEVKGRAEGERLGRVSTLQKILDQRSFPMSAELRARIEEAEGEQLETWIMRLAAGEQPSDVFRF